MLARCMLSSCVGPSVRTSVTNRHCIYYTFIHPYILYGLEVYGNTCVSYMDTLTKMKNKLLRILQKKGRKCCNECLYIQYGTLPPPQLFNYQVLSLVYKMVYLPHLLPPIFWDYFTFSISVHIYNVRHGCLYNLNGIIQVNLNGIIQNRTKIIF